MMDSVEDVSGRAVKLKTIQMVSTSLTISINRHRFAHSLIKVPFVPVDCTSISNFVGVTEGAPGGH